MHCVQDAFFSAMFLIGTYSFHVIYNVHSQCVRARAFSFFIYIYIIFVILLCGSDLTNIYHLQI
jgi:hypothetical protein